MAMTCFNRMNPETGRRLMPQTGLHLSAHFTTMLALIRMAGRSFGANGSSPLRSDCVNFESRQQESDARTHRTQRHYVRNAPDWWSKIWSCGIISHSGCPRGRVSKEETI